jgi:peptide/nickel transport system substrate-binding protein
MPRRLWRSLLLFCVCALLTVSCHRSTSDLAGRVPSPSERIVLGTTAGTPTIDPADAYAIFSGTLLYNLGDRLYTYKSGSTELQPQLATAMPSVSPDGLTYTIPLRQGVTFHDGSRFNAAAMAFSLERFIQNGGAASFLLSDLVKTVEAKGESELVIKLKKPFAAFPSLLAFSGACAVSPKAYEIKKGSFKPQDFVGTGPYRLVKFGTDRIQLDRFDAYWGNKPANQGIDIQIFSSEANLFNAFRTGAVDVAYQSLATEQINVLKEGRSSDWQVIEQPGSGIQVLTLNQRMPPLDRVEVRQAIAAIMDRPVLQNRVFQGQIEPLYSLIPSLVKAQQPVFRTQYGDGNADRAMELLQKVGYSESKPLKLEFWYRSNVTNDQLAAITLKAIAHRKLGKLVQFNLNSVESTTAYKNLDKGIYPLFLMDWSPDFFDPDNYIQPFMECTKGSPEKGCEEGSSQLWGSFYYSDRANKLIDRSRRELNPVSRNQQFGELQNLLAQDVPFIPLWQNKDYLFAQKWVEGAHLEVTKKVPFWTLKHRGDRLPA